MLEEAKTVCDHLIVCFLSDPSLDREEKNKPVQSIIEREIQVSGCRFVDEVIIYDTEVDLLNIIDQIDWDVRIIGEEYKDKDFTGRNLTLERCYFNKRPHSFSSSELRERVSKEHFKKT